MHVLSSRDIIVAQVVFCQNLCLLLFIGQENVLKLFSWLKDIAEKCCPCLLPGLCIKFRNETWRQIRYLGKSITNSQISTFDANEIPVMCNKGILKVFGQKVIFRTSVNAKK